ncbi:hypothetical protein RclHR1_18900004 [Rhizophagus clarus]|uniref:Uncharacterized protein n=1 Tax=Rhizophagus clarus TaxID=94130 RepID=A0A2Z6R3M4_9GLOM|nr:hypothetical protein RclHR1_18900004 [Rhizophagus clarus]GES90636.1 hypothetical protein GLOIN_2v1011475 [Rhizophagus clarus]
MSLRIQLILILTFLTTHGLTITIEKREVKDIQTIPGRSLESVFGPILVLCILSFEVFVWFSGALISKLTNDNINIKVSYAVYNSLNENAQSVGSSTTNYVLDLEEISASSNYVLDREETQTYSTDRGDQLPNTNTITSSTFDSTITFPTTPHTNSPRTIQNQISRFSLTRIIQDQRQSTSTSPVHNDSDMLSHANTVMIPQSNSPKITQYSLYSYI